MEESCVVVTVVQAASLCGWALNLVKCLGLGDSGGEGGSCSTKVAAAGVKCGWLEYCV